MKKSAILVLMSLFILGLTGAAHAELWNATDSGWSITFDTLRQAEPGDDTLREGLIKWVDPLSRNHIWEGSWWGRDNSGYGGEGPLSSTFFVSASNPYPNQILLNYKSNNDPQGNPLNIALLYSLTGSGLSSSIYERLTLTNPNDNAMSLSIFEYNDFDLTDTDDNDSAFGNASRITQYDNWSRVSVTPASTVPSHFQIETFPSLVNFLSDGSPTNLNDTGSPYGPGDATFAFQWDFTLEPGGTYAIDKIKNLTTTPEPVSCALFLFGGGALFARRRFCKRA